LCLSVLLTCFSIAVCCLFEQIYDDDDDDDDQHIVTYLLTESFNVRVMFRFRVRVKVWQLIYNQDQNRS